MTDIFMSLRHPRPEGGRPPEGVDGRIRFSRSGVRDGQAIVSVKGGTQLNPAMVQQLSGAVAQHHADMGVLVILRPSTTGMINAAGRGGIYTDPAVVTTYPRIQIITVAQLLNGQPIICQQDSLPTKLQPRPQDRKRFRCSESALDISVRDLLGRRAGPVSGPVPVRSAARRRPAWLWRLRRRRHPIRRRALRRRPAS